MFPTQPLCLFLILAVSTSVIGKLNTEPLPARHEARTLFSRQNRSLKQHRYRTTGSTAHVDSDSDGSGICSWHSESSTCGASLSAVSNILEQSEYSYGPFVAQYTVCAAATDKESCSAYEHCHWDSGVCQLFMVGLDTVGPSPCFQAAPATLGNYISDERCGLNRTQLSCLEHVRCAWNDEDYSCHSDEAWFYFGVSRVYLDASYEAVLDYKAEELRGKFHAFFDIESPDFDWAEVLDWEVPETECPEWSDYLICDYVDGMLSHGARSGLYCSQRYSSVDQREECMADDLCYFELESLSCAARRELYRPGFSAAFKNILPAVQTDTDRMVAANSYDCPLIDNEEECTGSCVWYPGAAEYPCLASVTWTASVVAAAGDDPTDGVCFYASALEQSGCADIHDADECSEHPNCTYTFNKNCWPSVDYLIQLITEQDEALADAISNLDEGCEDFKTKETCVGAH